MKRKLAAIAVSSAMAFGAAGVVMAPAALAATGTPNSPTNLSPNPILASNATGWATQSGGGGGTLSRVAVTDHVAASWAGKVVQSATTTRINEPQAPVTAGQQYSFASDVKAVSGASVQVTVSWYNSHGAFLSFSSGPSLGGVTPSSWTRFSSGNMTVPSGAADAVTVVNVIGGTKNQSVYVTQNDVEAVQVNQPPVASFTETTSGLGVNVNGSASTSQSGTTITGYAWAWGDGTANGSGVTASHTYIAAGTYTVGLTVTDSNNLQNTTSQQVTVSTGGGGTITNLPGQPAITDYQPPSGNGSNAVPYEHQGALIVAGQSQLSSQPIKDASAAGATVLAYLDPMILQPGFGTYADMLWGASACGPAVPQWASYTTGTGYSLADFRTTADGGGGVEQAKLQCVLEKIVSDNPQIGGFFADDLGSMSWYPGISWGSFGSANQQAWRDGAVALAQTFHTVAVEHHLMLMVNGTWEAGTLAASGGGYPDTNTNGLSLADGGYIEHHATSELSFWTAYAQGQWATASGDAAGGKPIMYVQASDQATMNAYNAAGVFSYLSYQTDYAQPAPVWGSFHTTGLPSHTS